MWCDRIFKVYVLDLRHSSLTALVFDDGITGMKAVFSVAVAGLLFATSICVGQVTAPTIPDGQGGYRIAPIDVPAGYEFSSPEAKKRFLTLESYAKIGRNADQGTNELNNFYHQFHDYKASVTKANEQQHEDEQRALDRAALKAVRVGNERAQAAPAISAKAGPSAPSSVEPTVSHVTPLPAHLPPDPGPNPNFAVGRALADKAIPKVSALGKHWIVKTEFLKSPKPDARGNYLPVGLRVVLEDGTKFDVATVPLGKQFSAFHSLADELLKAGQLSLDQSDAPSFPYMLSGTQYGQRPYKVKLGGQEVPIYLVPTPN